MGEYSIYTDFFEVDPKSLRLKGGRLTARTFDGRNCVLVASASRILGFDMYGGVTAGIDFIGDDPNESPNKLLAETSLSTDLEGYVERVRRAIENNRGRIGLLRSGREYPLGPMYGRLPDYPDYFPIRNDFGIYEVI